jgi:hypothetical protein
MKFADPQGVAWNSYWSPRGLDAVAAPLSAVVIAAECDGANEKRFWEFLSTSEPIVTSGGAADELGAPANALFK